MAAAALLAALLAVAAQATIFFEANDTKTWKATVNVYRNASINTNKGFLEMNPYANAVSGRAQYKKEVPMMNTAARTTAYFNTAFVFAIRRPQPEYFGDGLTFFLAPNLYDAHDKYVSSGGYLGLFNATTIGKVNNSIFAVEFDTHKNGPFFDPNNNHVGVDVNSVQSIGVNDLEGTGILLNSGKQIGCWIDYDGKEGYLWVYLAYLPAEKPRMPIIAMELNLTPILRDIMYVGFTSSTGTRAEYHTIYSWWFRSGFRSNATVPLYLGGILPPSPPRPPPRPPPRHNFTSIAAASSFAALFLLLLFLIAIRLHLYRKHSNLFSRLLLPLACWMYWKERSASDPSSSTLSHRYLRLSIPPVELFAWFWRRRHLRRRIGVDASKKLRFYPRPPLQIVLKRKMGPHYIGEAWEEGRMSKRRRSHVRASSINPRLINMRLQSCISASACHPVEEQEPLMFQSVPSDSVMPLTTASPPFRRADRNQRYVRFASRPGSITTAPPSPDVRSDGITFTGNPLPAVAQNRIDGNTTEVNAPVATVRRQSDDESGRPVNFGAGGPRKSLWLASYSARRHSVEVDAGFFEEDEEFQKKYAKITRRRRSILIPQGEQGTSGLALMQQQSPQLTEGGGSGSASTPPQTEMTSDDEREEKSKRIIDQKPFRRMMEYQQRRTSISLTPPDVSKWNDRNQQRRMSIRLPPPSSEGLRRTSISLPPSTSEGLRRTSISLPPSSSEGLRVQEDRKKKKQGQPRKDVEAKEMPVARRRSFMIVDPHQRETIIPSPPQTERQMETEAVSPRTSNAWLFD